MAAAMAASLLVETNARAQPIEALGIRAQGMAGAFVALADDPTAAYWNPAGLATGPFFGAALEGGTLERTPATLDANAERRSGLMVAASVPSIGFAYYGLRESAVVAADAGASQDRQDPRSSLLGLRSLVTHHVGITLVQSLTDGLVVGASFKYVRGYAAETSVAAPPDAAGTGGWLDLADELDGQGSNAFDLDVGVLGVFGPFRAGLVARHLTEPPFETREGGELRLERQVRAGVAVRPSERVSVGVDIDLVESPGLSGQARQVVAVGAEASPWKGLLVRGGVRTSLVGAHLVVPAVGGSLGLGRRFWIDGQWTFGDAERETGWGVGCRIGF